MQKSGYSMIEVFGVVALVLTLMVIAVPSIKNFTEGGKQGAAVRNASSLNSAVQQYDQNGGLLTAQVPVPPGVENITNPSQLPELAVLNLLRGDDRGGQVAAWQEPVFDNKGYRVIWVNSLNDQQALRDGLGGNRSANAESLAAAGDGGRFEVINDEGGRMGIVGFQRGEVDGALLVATTTTESPTPTPVTPNRAPTASLTVTPASALVGETFTYIAGGSDPDNDPLLFSFTHPGGTTPNSTNRVFTRSYNAPGTYTVNARVSDGSLSSQSQATVTVTAAPGVPGVTLAANPSAPHRGQAVTFTATGTDPEGQALTYRFIQDGAIVQQGASNTYTTSYANLGNPSMTVVAVDPTGLSGSDTTSVNVVNRAPSGNVIASPNPSVRNSRVVLTANITDPDEADRAGLSFVWARGGTGASIERSYDRVGEYPEAVTVTDAHGAAVTSSVAVKILNQAPSATLSVDRPTGVRGDRFTYTVTGADPDGDAIEYSFKVGEDGQWTEYQVGETFQQSFTTVGEKSVYARVRDSLGAVTESAPLKVNVTNRAPSVTVVSDKREGFRGETFTFTATGADPDGDSLVYSFNGGAFGASNVFRTSFNTVGNQTVTVVAKDALGKISTPASVQVQTNHSYHTLSAMASPSWCSFSNRTIASFSGTGTYRDDQIAPLRLTYIHEGYQLHGWQEGWGNTTSLSIPMSQDRKLIAEFIRRTYKVSLNVTAYASAGHLVNSAAIIYDFNGTIFGSAAAEAYSGTGGTPTSSINQLVAYVPYGTTIAYTGSSTGRVWNGYEWVGTDHYAGLDGQTYAQGSSSASYSHLKITAITSNTDLGSWGASTPLIVDMDGNGKPDLLAGPTWKLTPNRRPHENLNAFRQFALDDQGKKLWEWVGPSDALLVWTKNLQGTPDSSRLFGGFTWNKKWQNGFEPLAALDQNNDGILKGEELIHLGIWQDRNSDAQVQNGELQSLKDASISSLRVTPNVDGPNAHHPEGAILAGNTVAIWDWYSMQLPDLRNLQPVQSFNWTNREPPKGTLQIEVPSRMKPLTMNKGGNLQLFNIQGQYYMRVTSPTDSSMDLVYPASLDRGVIKWGLPDNTLTNYLFPSGGIYAGLTQVGNQYATWSAHYAK